MARVMVRRTAAAGGSLAVIAALFVVPLLMIGSPAPAVSQDMEELRRQAEEMLGRPISDAEILRQLRQSGLSPDEVRRRLESRGLDPAAADGYLEVLEGTARSVPPGTNAMSVLEVLAEVQAESRSHGRLDTALAEDTAFAEVEPDGPPIFGRQLFRRMTSQFQPLTSGPVPPDYRMGPDDELVVVLTGGIEQAYRLTVSREGWVVIPDVGRVFVNGLTLDGLERALFNRLSQVYSGIREGPEATTFLDVSVGRLRTNQVYVIGEVERPSAYAVSSLASAMGALYEAGGPNENGSFREIAVNRGGTTVARIDLYDYLLRGDASQDIRLEQGDIVFVPMVERRVEADGAVMRPGLYELKEGEDLADLIRFAGGVAPNADLRRVQIQRILADGARGPGQDRTVMDVTLADAGGEVSLRGGDRVTVFAVLDRVSNVVVVSGAVWRPGAYAAEPGTTLWEMIERAGGLLPDAVEARVQIQRLEEGDWIRRMIPVSLERDPDGTPLQNPEIKALDQVFVYAKRELREGRVVSIGGWVQQPGVYPYVEGMSVRDLILKAGGLRSGAYLEHAEVSRVVISQQRTDALTRRFQVPLDSSYVFEFREDDRDGSRLASGASGDPLLPSTDRATGGTVGDGAATRERESTEFILRNLDAVFVRKAPGFEPQQNVIVTGEVLLSGPYTLEKRGERLTELIARTGGLTPEAYPEGLQLWRTEEDREMDDLTAVEIAGRSFRGVLSDAERLRLAEAERAGEVGTVDAVGALGAVGETDTVDQADGRTVPSRPVREEIPRTRVGVDFLEAMRNPDGPHNVLVEPNDSIFVPRYIATVQVRGAVGVPTQVLYREGAGLSHYISQAGSYTDRADKKRTRVRLANGEVHTRGGKFLIFGGGTPKPDPGSVITVPMKPEREGQGLQLGQLVGILTSVMTATATVIIATR